MTDASAVDPFPRGAPVVTLDGPSGSGKGTLSRALAARLGWHLLDSGALYRLVGLVALRAGWHSDRPGDAARAAAAAAGLDVTFAPARGSAEQRVLLAGEDVSARIRAQDIAEIASAFAALAPVRAGLLHRQRGFAQPPGLVADGRDMGTVVFPEARLKVFVTASARERAGRRRAQLCEQGRDASIDRIYLDIRARDDRDATREHSPLQPACDAVVLDTTGSKVEESLSRLVALLAGRGLV